MFDAIVAAGERLAEATDVRAVVLSGNGRGFCAGLDMASFQGMTESSPRSAGENLLQRDDRPENRAQRPALVWKRLPMPVIAAIHGVAYGGGCQIALGADIRFAAPDADVGDRDGGCAPRCGAKQGVWGDVWVLLQVSFRF